jgi:ornithine cyclodeaminase/alanine dehydrogenase-like protein (mu-crystallin family)
MTWLLDNEDVAHVLTIGDCLEVLEETFRDYAQGRAVNRPRSHSYAPVGESPQRWYMLKTMDAVLPRYGVGGIRLTSDIVIERMADGKLRREKPGLAPGGRWTELVLLFSIETGELLAILPGGYLQRLRVGATSGLCAKYVARPGAKRTGLIGTGGLAGPHLEALTRIYSLEEVKVFSPTEKNRQAFVEHWRAKLDTRIEAVAHARAAIDGAEIVSLVTNSLSPVLEGEWLRPGMHINSVQRGELDNTTIERSDVVVVRSRDRDSHWYIGVQAPAEVEFDLSEDPVLCRKMRTLGGIIAGREEGRTRPDQITLFSGSGLGSAGLGIQLIGVAARAFEKARQHGLGRELPTDWFSQEIHS